MFNFSSIKDNFLYFNGTIMFKFLMSRFGGEGHKIRQSIIISFFIYMMYFFFGQEISTNLLFDNKSMFSNIIFIFMWMMAIIYKDISSTCFCFSIYKSVMLFPAPINAMIITGTFIATKIFMTFFNFIWRNIKSFFTYYAIFFDTFSTINIFTFVATKFCSFNSIWSKIKIFITKDTFFNHNLSYMRGR